jgi:hypothetical protein
MSSSCGIQNQTSNGSGNINTINVIDVVIETVEKDKDVVSVKSENPLMNLFKRFIREDKNANIPDIYTVGTHNEYKSECQRLMREFLTHIKTYEKIKSVMDSIDSVIDSLCKINL